MDNVVIGNFEGFANSLAEKFATPLLILELLSTALENGDLLIRQDSVLAKLILDWKKTNNE